MILRLRLLKKKVNSNKTSVQRQPELTRKVQELDDLRHTVEKLQKTLDAIPPEIKVAFRKTDNRGKNTIAMHKNFIPGLARRDRRKTKIPSGSK